MKDTDNTLTYLKRKNKETKTERIIRLARLFNLTQRLFVIHSGVFLRYYVITKLIRRILFMRFKTDGKILSLPQARLRGIQCLI